MNTKKILIGTFYSPMKYYGYKRCDLHPRWSPDGNFISIDSTHEDKRKTFLIDENGILIFNGEIYNYKEIRNSQRIY